jgi:hypothetical protein
MTKLSLQKGNDKSFPSLNLLWAQCVGRPSSLFRLAVGLNVHPIYWICVDALANVEGAEAVRLVAQRHMQCWSRMYRGVTGSAWSDENEKLPDEDVVLPELRDEFNRQLG